MISVFAFYSDDPSLSPAKAAIGVVLKLLENNQDKWKRGQDRQIKN